MKGGLFTLVLFAGLLAALPVSAFDASLTVTGRVTAISVHENFVYLQSDEEPSRVWRAEFWPTAFPKDLMTGDLLCVSGGVNRARDPRPRVRDSVILARTPRGAEPLKPIPFVPLADIGRDPSIETNAVDWWGARVTTQGRIVDVNRRDRWAQVLLADEQGAHLQAYFYQPYKEPIDPDLRIGAELRVTGNALYSPTVNPWTLRTEGVSNPLIYVERPETDIVFLTRAPWWTPQRFVIALVILLLAALASVFWAALQRHKRLEDRKLSDALGRERLRLAGELHDNFQQLLAGCMFRLGAAMQLADEENAAELNELEKLGDLLNHAQNDLRTALWGMREEAEGPTALSALLKYASDRMPHWRGKVHFTTIGAERPLSRRYSGAFLLLLQEAIGNALKHAQPTRIDVTVTFEKRAVSLSVKDDGCGFDAAKLASGEASSGLGVLSMKTRVERIGGGFRIVSTPGKGTEVKVKVRL